MNIKHSIRMILTLLIAGCTSTSLSTQTQPIGLSSPATSLSPVAFPTHTLTLVNTLMPMPTLMPSRTPIPLITPQAGYDIWDQVSKPGVYIIQYPKSDWIEETERLAHTALARCFLAEHGGSDMCMAGGCPTPQNITLGDVAFSKMALSDSFAIYTSDTYFGISIEAHSFDHDALCIEEAEKVLNTVQIRPERGCIDRAAFVADVTIPDNTLIPTGTKFIKTWRLKNIGTCPWTQQYTLVIYGKSSGTEADWVSLHENVQPEQTIDISIEIPAPLIEGPARWEGVLKNEFGDSFGLGSEPYTDMFGKPFWVQIIVIPAPTP